METQGEALEAAAPPQPATARTSAAAHRVPAAAPCATTGPARTCACWKAAILLLRMGAAAGLQGAGRAVLESPGGEQLGSGI